MYCTGTLYVIYTFDYTVSTNHKSVLPGREHYYYTLPDAVEHQPPEGVHDLCHEHKEYRVEVGYTGIDQELGHLYVVVVQAVYTDSSERKKKQRWFQIESTVVSFSVSIF